MDLLKELIKRAAAEEAELKKIKMLMEACSDSEPVKFSRLERQYDAQLERLLKTLREIKRCLKSIKQMYTVL